MSSLGDLDSSYLWKTETQLNSPLAHFALYLLKSGLTDSRKGPINGIFHVGPTIDPFSHMYLTVRGQSI